MTTMQPVPVIVGHQDTLLSLYIPERGKGRSFFERSDEGHLDLPRAREGGVAGGFFAIFVPAPPAPPAPPEPIKINVNPTNAMTVIRTDKGYEMPYAPSIDIEHARRITMAMMAELFRLEAASNGQLGVVRTIEELIYYLNNDIHAAILHFEGAEAIDADLD